MFITTHTVTKRHREGTKGVEFLVQLKNGSTTWATLKYTKNSYPVQMEKYVVHCCIAGDPEFAW